MRTRIKICCISSKDEAKMAIEAGADALGLVGNMPSGPGVISDERIREIAESIPAGVASFLLTSETETDKIIEHHKRTNTNTIQIVDRLAKGSYSDLREAIPAVKLVQVIHVLNEASVEEALEVAENVDAILLDSGNPCLTIKVLGGTGKTHDWSLSRKIRETVPVPVFLAGGIGPHNIRRAIEEVEPFGIDLCSSVRTNDHLDPEKLKALFDTIAGK